MNPKPVETNPIIRNMKRIVVGRFEHRGGLPLDNLGNGCSFGVCFLFWSRRAIVGYGGSGYVAVLG